MSIVNGALEDNTLRNAASIVVRSIHNTSMVGGLYRKENCRIIGHVVLGYINFLFVTMNAMLD